MKTKWEGINYLLDQFVSEEDLTKYNYLNEDITPVPSGALATRYQFSGSEHRWKTLTLHYTPAALAKSHQILDKIE